MKIYILSILALSSSLFAQDPSIERLDPALDQLISPEAKIEIITQGFRWTEGPVWHSKSNELLFSDIPNNVIHAWSEKGGLRVFMKPSGYTGITDYGREPGSNGLAFDNSGCLILAEHGDRRISMLTKNGGKITLADRYDGKRFNSPNDLVVHSNGSIYFTDPIYGLPKGENDPAREMDYCGIFHLAPDGKVTLISKELDRPNGITLSHDEKTLFVASSQSDKRHLYQFSLTDEGHASDMKLFYDANHLQGKGGTDGLKADESGNIWSTGPGGLLILSKEGKLLGRVLTHQPTSNIAFGGHDQKTVFLTANDRIMRFQRK